MSTHITPEPTWAEKAAQAQREADRLFARSDTLFARGHDSAAHRAIHEGRRFQAQADRYRRAGCCRGPVMSTAIGAWCRSCDGWTELRDDRCIHCGGTVILESVLDAVSDVLVDDPATPSVIARRAKVTTAQAHEALRWLVSWRMAVPVGNGAWTRYRTRRAGERGAW